MQLSANKLLRAIRNVVKLSYDTRHCTVDEDPGFKHAPTKTIDLGYISETLRKWLEKQSETIINDVLPRHAKLFHMNASTDIRTALFNDGDIPVCPELFNESEIVEAVSDNRSRMRAVFYLALWSCISHTNYIIIASVLDYAAACLAVADGASPTEMQDIVWNLVWGYYKCSSALAAYSLATSSRLRTGIREIKIFFVSSGLMSACTVVKQLLLISSKDLNTKSFLYSDLSTMTGDDKSTYYYYFGHNCLPLITSSLIVYVRWYVQYLKQKITSTSHLRIGEIAEMLYGEKCAKTDYQTQRFFVKFLVHFDDRLYWNRFLGPPIKAIRKQAEALPSEQHQVLPHVATEGIISKRGTPRSSINKEYSNYVQTSLLHEKPKAKTVAKGIKRKHTNQKQRDNQCMEEVRESKKSKGGTTSRKEGANSNESSTELLYKKTKAKKDLEEVKRKTTNQKKQRDIEKKRAKKTNNNDSPVKRNLDNDFSTTDTSTGITSFPVRLAERTKESPATIAQRDAQRKSSHRENTKSSAQREASSKKAPARSNENAKTMVQRRTSPKEKAKVSPQQTPNLRRSPRKSLRTSEK
jgi:hypothetical protein